MKWNWIVKLANEVKLESEVKLGGEFEFVWNIKYVQRSMFKGGVFGCLSVLLTKGLES